METKNDENKPRALYTSNGFIITKFTISSSQIVRVYRTGLSAAIMNLVSNSLHLCWGRGGGGRGVINYEHD